MELKLKNVRLAFPSLFEAKTVAGEGKPAFSATFILDPNDPQVDAINEAIDGTAAAKWGAKYLPVLAQIKKADKTCLHDGDLKATYEGFADMLFVSARNPTRPLVIGADRRPLLAADGKPYAGCYVNAKLEIWAQDNQYGKRINATLMGVQFARDGDSFTGGGSASEDDFDDVSATADDLA